MAGEEQGIVIAATIDPTGQVDLHMRGSMRGISIYRFGLAVGGLEGVASHVGRQALQLVSWREDESALVTFARGYGDGIIAARQFESTFTIKD